MAQDLILVTGASGFVGGAVADRLRRDRHSLLRLAVRSQPGNLPRDSETVIADLAAQTDWSGALDGVTQVVHAAARVHVMREDAADPLTAYRHTNVDGTLTARGESRTH